MTTYLRFVVADIHENSWKELGVFHAVLRLREGGKLDEHEEELHDATRQWFKDTAKDHLAHIRDLVAILRSHRIAVQMLKTDRVGYVVYEDEYQIVAEPFTNESY
jgi:hypothetical protein